MADQFVEYTKPAFADRIRVFHFTSPQEVGLRLRDATATDNLERYTARMTPKQARTLAALLLQAADAAEVVRG